jgi:hypothetical protein
MTQELEKFLNYLILLVGFLIFIFYFYYSYEYKDDIFVMPYINIYGKWSCAGSYFCIQGPGSLFSGGKPGFIFYFGLQLSFIISWVYIRSDILKFLKLIHKKI